MDPFYVTSHVRDDHMAAKKMDLPLHSTFVDSAPLVHTGNFGLESPSKQHSSLAESIDTVVSATTPTCNPINPLLESVPTVESVEQRSVLPQPIGEQPQDTQSPEGSPTLQPKRLHVSNIPFRYREHDLRTLFGVCSCVYLHCHCSAWRAKYMRVSSIRERTSSSFQTLKQCHFQNHQSHNLSLVLFWYVWLLLHDYSILTL